MLSKGDGVENTVAEIRFRNGAQTRDGMRRGELPEFGFVGVRRMYEAPTFVYWRVIEQQADRRRTQ